MDSGIIIYVDLENTLIRVGQMWSHSRGGRESLSFVYDRDWLRHPHCFPLDPILQLTPHVHHAALDKPFFGAIEDSAPDRWGRLLMRRLERKKAEQEGRKVSALREIDFLLQVNDETRQGALRFQREEGLFLTTYEKQSIPPLVSLHRLLSAATHVLQDHETEEDLRLLLAPGSSLGGARPKASVRDKDGHLAIVKFPKEDDEVDIIAWEAVALSLSHAAGIRVPVWRLETVGKKRVLVSRRFDRWQGSRLPFLSAMSALSAKDNELHSYLEIADVIRRMSCQPREDLIELWRRMVFHVLISNVDDHLRNHAFIYRGLTGWSLSPAYDLNPTPQDIKPRILSTAIDLVDPSASLSLTMSVSPYFDIPHARAKEIVREMAKVVSSWRQEAIKWRIKKTEIERMSSAFEHEDLREALRF
ncbi:MAG: type II toxin-antitoxin system HipA family toxin [Chlamydiae bacterium]|nr:type II toxin-antitoxin system HipA family toxin [Chlamydiota bacterium]